MFFSRHKKNFNSAFPRQIIFTGLGLVVVMAIAWPLFKNISKQYRINSEIKELEKEIAAFENKNSDLKKTLEYLESDQFSQEQARVNLNYKKEGEEIVIIKNLSAELKNDQTENILDGMALDLSHQEEKIGNPTRWWRHFFLK